MALFFISFSITFFLACHMRSAIAFYGFLSRQDYRRRWYKGPTPLLGGLAIFASLIFTDLIFTYNINPILLASLPLIFIGIIDDQREISYKVNYALQLVAIAIWLYLKGDNTQLLNPFGLTPFLNQLIAAVWVFFIINAVKSIDGMDGLASGFGVVICIFMFQLNGNLQNPHILLSLTGALCGFIYWNLMPASIYLGGTGGQLIGFILATQILSWEPTNYNSYSTILIPLFLFAFPEVNVLFAVIRRVAAVQSIFVSDGQHIYHSFLRSGFSVTKAWFIIMTGVSVVAYFATLLQVQESTSTVLGFSALIVVLFSFLLYIVLQMEEVRKDYFDFYLQTLFKQYLQPVGSLEVTSEDCLIVYSFSDFKTELLRLKNNQMERWLVDSVQFIKTRHSQASQIFMSLDGDLLVLDPKINGALKFHNFHQSFHDFMCTSANHNEFWPLLLLKYMPIIEVGRLPGNIDITITEIESEKVA